jgi:hypothetical protein
MSGGEWFVVGALAGLTAGLGAFAWFLWQLVTRLDELLREAQERGERAG